MRLLLIFGLGVLALGLSSNVFLWIFIGLLLVAAALGLIWQDAPITDHRSKPKEPRKRRWIG